MALYKFRIIIIIISLTSARLMRNVAALAIFNTI